MPGQDKLHLPLKRGLDYSSPSTESPWNKLTNVYLRHGALRLRPAVMPVSAPELSPMRTGEGVVIAEQYGTDETNQRETLVPTATVAFPGSWAVNGAATAHQAVDDFVTDDAANISGPGATGVTPTVVTLTFGTPALTYLSIDGIVVRVLVRSTGEAGMPGTAAQLRHDVSGVVKDFLIPGRPLDPSSPYEPTWFEFYFPEDPDNASALPKAWTVAGLTAKNWSLLFRSTSPQVVVHAWNIEVAGRFSTAASPAAFKGRVVITTNSFMRYEGSIQPWTNIRGVVPDPTGGPLEKWDVCALQSSLGIPRLYFVNGRDTTYFYPTSVGAGLMGQLANGTPIGRTCMAFGERLMLGDVTEGVRDEQRLRWSAHLLFGGVDNWTDATSGNLELWGGQGRCVKILPLSAQLAVAYREQGIFNISWTGRDDTPFIPQIMTPFIGCVAKATVCAAINNRGALVHLFLGRGPEGLNVYEYNGATARPVGYEIRPKLIKDSAPSLIRFAFGAMDPERNLYLLFVAEHGEVQPNQCWVWEIKSEQWYRWEFPAAIHVAGQLSLEPCLLDVVEV